MSTKRVSTLIKESGATIVRSHGDAFVSSFVADSRACSPGSLFVCMPSKSSDTHAFLREAASAGATACIVHAEEGFHAAQLMQLSVILVDRTQPGFNMSVGALARAFYDDPSARMRVFGITGTNGKTTTAWMMRDALRSLGRKASYLGTLGFDPDGDRRELSNTTPFPVETWQLLGEAAQKGVQDFVMEASSHALFERRLTGVRFEVGVFTNLSQDHLDFHGDMKSYAAAKGLLFTEYAKAAGADFRSAVNVGDAVGRDIARALMPTVSFGTESADLNIVALKKSVCSLMLRANYLGDAREIEVGVGGMFNVWNATSSLAGLLAAGTPLDDACHAMSTVTPVPGRFESVPTDQGFGIIVDYAHTDDALEKLLHSVRELNPKRVITVFGCGGDRDKTKRPKMARAASENSDLTIVTSDNPRTEDPQEILNDVVKGLVAGSMSEAVIDRREAIKRAIALAQQGDVVVIAGKGHENYQIIGRTKHHMDDRELAREALACR